MGLAARISLVVGAVLTGGGASCSEVCVKAENDQAILIDHTMSHDELCLLERAGKLDAFIAVASSYNARIDPATCVALCGGNPAARHCENYANSDPAFTGYRPDAAAPPDTCPFADRIDQLTLACFVMTTTTNDSCGADTAAGQGCSKRDTSKGRRPEGYEPVAGRAGAPGLGAYFAACAHLEAASVIAFEALRDELAAHDFPAAVLDACARAAREEIAHAEVSDRLARRFGGETLPRFEAHRTVPRALVDIAVENAVEGCVGELFGAAEALFCARRASDPEIRVALERIAADEMGHAELSEQIGELLATRLDAAERALVRNATNRARRELRGVLERRVIDPAVASIAGVPHRAEALALFDALEDAIWSPNVAA